MVIYQIAFVRSLFVQIQAVGINKNSSSRFRSAARFRSFFEKSSFLVVFIGIFSALFDACTVAGLLNDAVVIWLGWTGWSPTTGRRGQGGRGVHCQS